ncbi:MAG: PLDc N-terminal domain-containing protein [Gammaproteobacteria bacterium]
MEGGILGLLVLIADIYAIIKIVQSGAPTGNKVIWVVIVLLLPVVGVVAWFLIGPGGRSG